MKTLFALLLVSVPVCAQAMGMHGGMGPRPGGIHGAIALYALLGALGYWVLQHAGRQEKNYVKRSGVTLGMALLAVGLLGVLCGLGGHIKNSMPSCGKCPDEEIAQGGHEMPVRVDVKVTKSEKTR